MDLEGSRKLQRIYSYKEGALDILARKETTAALRTETMHVKILRKAWLATFAESAVQKV